MQLGIVTPVLTALPGAHAGWEQSATIEDVAAVAEAADRLGYHHLTCSEHVGVPTREAARRGARYWDPLATFGYLAARTARIRLATYVLVLGYHHPLQIAKQYGTLDQLSGGRVTLGVGVGTLKAEFDLLGVSFDDRGARADDALRALRASLSQPQPAYAGEFYAYEGFVVDPCARQPRLPIWIGGGGRRSLDRAVGLADGWCPFGLSPRAARELLQRVELPPGFEVVLQLDSPIDPVSASPDEVREVLGTMAVAGATVLSVRFVHHSKAHYVEQLEALAPFGPAS